MSDPGDADPLRDLGERLERARLASKGGRSDGPRDITAASQNGFGFALRVGVELVAALAVGLGIGWAFDHWLGTRPWGLVTFFFLGAAAGILNVYRAVGEMGMLDSGAQAGAIAPSAQADQKDEEED